MKSIFLFVFVTAQVASAQFSTSPFRQNAVYNNLQVNKESRFVFRHTGLNGPPRTAFSVSDKKSVGMAVVYSLLLPGMGELYAGDYGTGKYLTITEGALWLTFGAFQWYGSWIRDDARKYAIQHAQVNIENKNDQYFVDIGNFRSVDAYNEEILRERAEHKLYDPNSTFYWKWDNDANREQYRELRVSSDNVFNNANFVVAAIGVNHLISAINAARITISHNKGIEEAEFLNIHASVIGGLTNPQGIMISVSKNF